jgi:hypothetical protein
MESKQIQDQHNSCDTLDQILNHSEPLCPYVQKEMVNILPTSWRML